MKIVIATENEGKAREIRKIFPTATIPSVPVEYPPEGGDYRANAVAKAEAAMRATGLPAIADDSGLEVDALGGRPGVKSARYGANDEERIDRLLRELQGKPNRRARFRCVAACVFPDGRTKIAEETWEGEILPTPKGTEGFGYDPIFFDPEFGKAAAEMTAEEKLSRSHRGKAFRKLASLLFS